MRATRTRLAGIGISVLFLLLAFAWFAKPKSIRTQIEEGGFHFTKYAAKNNKTYLLSSHEATRFETLLKSNGFSSTDFNAFDSFFTKYSRGINVFGYSFFTQEIWIDRIAGTYVFEPNIF